MKAMLRAYTHLKLPFFFYFTHKSKNCTQTAKCLTSLAKWSSAFKISLTHIKSKYLSHCKHLVTLQHKSSHKQHRYICSNRQTFFILCQKIIRILSKDRVPWRYFCKFPTVNISKLNFWVVICIAENFIWTNLNGDFLNISIFMHPQIPDFQILSNHNKPYINGKIIYSLWWCINAHQGDMLAAISPCSPRPVTYWS